MKIAFCEPGYSTHNNYRSKDLLGTELQIYGLAKELARRGNETFILRKWTKSNPENERIEGVNVINVKSPELLDFRLQKIFTKILFSKYVSYKLMDIDPDVIVLTDLLSSYFISSLRYYKIYVTHNPPFSLYEDNRVIRGKLKKFFEDRIFSKSDSIIALNEAIQKSMIERRYFSRYIPNGIDLGFYNPVCIDDKYIIYSGRLEKTKSVDCLIEAYSQLNRNILNEYKLLICGYGPERKHLLSLVNRLQIGDKVNFKPWTNKEEFLDLVSRCSVFVLPSIFECMPNVLLEAMALSKPVIASNVPGSKDLIQHGYNGLLFESKNIDALEKALTLLLSDYEMRKQMGNRGRKLIEKKYNFEVVAQSYMDILNEIMK